MSFLLKTISTLCSFAALALFVQWLSARLTSSYRGGLEVLSKLDVPSVSVLDEVPLGSALNSASVAFLPAIDRLRQSQQLNVPPFLRDCESKLIRAGLRPRLSPEQFLAFSFVSALAIGTAAALLGLLFGTGLAGGIVFVFTPAAFAGFFAPTIVLNNVISNRVSLIQKRLPFAIEFMLLSMEARAAFPAAIEIYCHQMPNDPLAHELEIALRDMRYGISPQEALTNLAARIRSSDVSAFAMAVNTGLDTGQPIKDILQVQSDAARQRRYQSAEEVAKTAATRAIFPLMIVAIAVFMLLLGPLVIRVIQQSMF